MDVEEHSFDFARDVVKQFIVLSSALPALMITFSKDFVSDLPLDVKSIAFWSWGFFLGSVLFGLLTLMAITGSLAERAKSTVAKSKSKKSLNKGILSSNIRVFASIQIAFFFIGLALVVVFGWKAA